MYLRAGSPKNALILPGMSFSFARAAWANCASSDSLLTDARPRLSCFTFFQTHRPGSGQASTGAGRK
jgi:hypothetical protein